MYDDDKYNKIYDDYYFIYYLLLCGGVMMMMMRDDANALDSTADSYQPLVTCTDSYI